MKMWGIRHGMAMRRIRIKSWLRRDAAVAWIFLVPSGIGFSLFYLIPFAQGVIQSFVDGSGDSRSVSLDHYRELLASGSFRNATLNTFYLSAVCVPIMLAVSLGLAMLLNKPLYLRKWLRTAYVMPLVVPVASIILIWQILFDWNGSLNLWLSDLGQSRVDWMKTEAARNVVILIYIWKNMGYNIILFLAGLQQIPKDYYETAQVEGAGRWWQLRSITLVYLTSTTFFVTIMSIINSFKIFRETYLIAGDYPHDSIYMLQHYMNNMFMELDIPKLTAAATLMVGGILVIVAVLFGLESRHRRFME